MPKTIARKAAEPIGAIRFSTYLEASALELERGKRGERSRLKLMSAGLRLLDNCRFQDLKIEDVCLEAGLAKGTFYIYFASKDEFLRELARAYCNFELNTLPHSAHDASRFALSRMWVGWYERTFVANVGILRCVVRMGENDAVMRDLWVQRNASVVRSMLSATLRDKPVGDDEARLLLWSLRTIGGMLDQSLFDRYGLQTPSGQEDPGDAELLVDMHAVLTYRALYGEEPPAQEIGHAATLARLGILLRDARPGG